MQGNLYQKKGQPRSRSALKLPDWEYAVNLAQASMPDQRKALPGAKAWSPMLLQPTAAYFGHSEVLSKSNRAKERCWSCKCVIEYASNLQAELCVLVVLILQLCDASTAKLICATLATLPSILRYPLEHLLASAVGPLPTFA